MWSLAWAGWTGRFAGLHVRSEGWLPQVSLGVLLAASIRCMSVGTHLTGGADAAGVLMCHKEQRPQVGYRPRGRTPAELLGS